ncbi:MAG: hypothetical protein KA981_04260 [Bacteroidia bacterium]|jgi:hypothetical protein|nr:hypothetical protein [Bacteroidia bacterium]
MKILALEKEMEGAEWSNIEALLSQEAQHVFKLYLSGSLREIYFTEENNAVLILETKDAKMAKELLDDFPLVKNKKIRFDILELRPYKGFERIIPK